MVDRINIFYRICKLYKIKKFIKAALRMEGSLEFTIYYINLVLKSHNPKKRQIVVLSFFIKNNFRIRSIRSKFAYQ